MLDQRSKDLRKLIIRALVGGGRGHVGAAFSLVEILRVLYDDVIRDGDKVILSDMSAWDAYDRLRIN